MNTAANIVATGVSLTDVTQSIPGASAAISLKDDFIAVRQRCRNRRAPACSTP